jgi:hypothetical protein
MNIRKISTSIIYLFPVASAVFFVWLKNLESGLTLVDGFIAFAMGLAFGVLALFVLMILDAFIKQFIPKTPHSLAYILECVDGGIYKRIDENRELLEFLNEKAPKLLEEHPWVIGWIKSNDDYLKSLENLVEPLRLTNFQFKENTSFPRPWPVIHKKPQG